VSPEARLDYEHLVRDQSLPEGALVAIFHDAGASGPAGPVYVMEKAAGTWRYLSLRSDGSVEATPGVGQQLSAGACAGCHQGGLGDSLFGPPRPAPPPR
jgi:mono/diheme cytochrome c family protein